jgi:hypothetical protein
VDRCWLTVRCEILSLSIRSCNQLALNTDLWRQSEQLKKQRSKSLQHKTSQHQPLR